jgi:hypothetical protein
MALSMEEQRILAEIERQLADDDPSLAVRLSTFRRPGLTARLRTPRGRMLVSLFVVAAVALLSLMVYSLMPLRVLPDHGSGGQPTAAPSRTGQTAQASQAATGTPAGAAAPSAGRARAKGKAPAAASGSAAAGKRGTGTTATGAAAGRASSAGGHAPAADRKAPTPSTGPAG